MNKREKCPECKHYVAQHFHNSMGGGCNASVPNELGTSDQCCCRLGRNEPVEPAYKERTLNAYQKAAARTAVYPSGSVTQADALKPPVVYLEHLYLALGLCGEAGEVAEKVKKALRDGASLVGIEKELGDVLWYLSELARQLGVTLEDVAALNLKKLEDRQNRGVLGGSGDDR